MCRPNMINEQIFFFFNTFKDLEKKITIYVEGILLSINFLLQQMMALYSKNMLWWYISNKKMYFFGGTFCTLF
jgi:hypothetical protein